MSRYVVTIAKPHRWVTVATIKRDGFTVGVGTSRAHDPKEALRRARSETTYRRITHNLTPWSNAT